MNFTEQIQNSLLKDVSRSFYLSFKILPKKIRSVMGLGYLLCRAADTIADTPSTQTSEKLKLLGQFRSLFATFPIPSDRLTDFLRDLDNLNLTPKVNEQRLLKNFNRCTAWFNSLTRSNQALIQSVVTAVITGMEMDLKIFDGSDAESAKAMPTDKELEAYIHWIGGEPGRFWTSVCLSHLPVLNIPNPDRMLQDGIIFGTGLQMVNILRDFPEDLKMGRCYIPTELLNRDGIAIDDIIAGKKEDEFRKVYVDLIDQTIFRLERGLSYISQLPKFSLGLRAAVWWPLMIGMKTLKKLRETPNILKTTGPVKIKRSQIYGLILTSFFLLPFDALLKKEFEKLD